MRGRTNYTGGAKPVINGDPVNCVVADGATINKGDFVELYGKYKISEMLSFQTSAIKSAKLGDHLFVLAIRASTKEWTVRIVDTTSGDIEFKAMYSVTLGNGYTSVVDVNVVALENNRFALFGSRADNYLGVTLQLYKYESGAITRLASEYFYSSGTGSYNPSEYAPVCAVTGKRIVVSWYNYSYFRVYSYADDVLTKLNTSDFVKGSNSYIEDEMYLQVPGGDFFVGLSRSADYMSLQKVVSNDEITYWTRTSLPRNPGTLASNVIFVDNNCMLLLASYKGSGSYDYETNTLELIDTRNLGVVSSLGTSSITGMPSNRGNRIFGALAPLGDGYFVMFEGKSANNSSVPRENVNYLSYGRATAEQGIKILDCVEVAINSQYAFLGQGGMFADVDKNCFYAECYSLDGKTYNTSYMKFHIANDKIIMRSDTLYAKAFNMRFDGVAESSGSSGETISVLTPAGYKPPELTK